MHELLNAYRPYFRMLGWVILAILAWYVVSQTLAAMNAPTPKPKQDTPAVSITTSDQKGKTPAKKPVKETINKIGEVQVVIAGSLNIRSDASRGSKQVGSAPKGSKLGVISKTGGWYQVVGPKGEKGYVTASTRYVKVLWMK